MPYYTKIQISEFIKEVLERAKSGDVKIMSDVEETTRQLSDESDIVGLFWVEQKKVDGSENLKIIMDGKAFVKIDFDLYSDDRYAIDSYQAVKEGTTVSEVVKKRAGE